MTIPSLCWRCSHSLNAKKFGYCETSVVDQKSPGNGIPAWTRFAMICLSVSELHCRIKILLLYLLVDAFCIKIQNCSYGKVWAGRSRPPRLPIPWKYLRSLHQQPAATNSKGYNIKVFAPVFNVLATVAKARAVWQKICNVINKVALGKPKLLRCVMCSPESASPHPPLPGRRNCRRAAASRGAWYCLFIFVQPSTS